MQYFISPIHSQKSNSIGIKVFVISKAKTGYILIFQVYTGAVSGVSSSKKHGVAYRVVMELVDNYERKCYCLLQTTTILPSVAY